MRRDTIVVGASSGGIPALKELLARLPRDLPAAVLIVQHRAPTSQRLASILDAASHLPVISATETQAIRLGHVYVAPADRHMVIAHETVTTVHGPRENRSRPSIDVLFRTAAAQRSARVTGVLLSGLLDDGVAGLSAVRRCGGATLAQDPKEAGAPDLPRNAIEAGVVDRALPLAELAEVLVAEAGLEVEPVEVPEEIAIEASVSRTGRCDEATVDRLGTQVGLSCPDCGGQLWKVGSDDVSIYRCHVGHAMTARTLLESQDELIEQSLWAALRALDERARMLERLAKRAPGTSLTLDYEGRAREARQQVERARHFLLDQRRSAYLEGDEQAEPAGTT